MHEYFDKHIGEKYLFYTLKFSYLEIIDFYVMDILESVENKVANINPSTVMHSQISLSRVNVKY